MRQVRIPVRYAKALFVSAKDKNILDAVSSDMLLILGSFKEYKIFREFLSSPVVKPAQKHEALVNIFHSRVNDLTMSFFTLLTQNKREDVLEDVARYFVDLYKKEKGIVTVTVTTAVAIDDGLRNKIKSAVGSNVDFIEKVNTDIIGDIILNINDIQYDASVASELKKLKRNLVNTQLLK